SLQGKISSDGCLKKEQMVVSAIASTPQSARTALRNIRNKGHDPDTASWVSLKNDPRVFTNGADEKHGFIFVDDDDQSVLVVASWVIDEYGSPLTTY
ncbi:hypothetical protein, partial [Escherichia coli]|uniref:hypothetical protein n=1 Tax=Escherichia coli TaxID=562 RepID=UPI0020756566